MDAIFTTLIVIGIIFGAIAVGVLIVRAKLNSMTKRYLGMNLKQTGDLIGKGLKDEVSTPKSISNVSAMYKPMLMRDFPDMSYERFLEIANSSFLSVLTAIEEETTDKLRNATDSLKERVSNIISDNRGRNVIEHFDEIKIHRTAIAHYSSSSDTAKAIFEISFQCKHFFEGSKKKKEAEAENPTQYAASITLCYGQKYQEDTTTMTFAHNCPNCGAPVYSVGGRMMKCKYCGTGVTEEIHKSWLADSFKFIK